MTRSTTFNTKQWPRRHSFVSVALTIKECAAVFRQAIEMSVPLWQSPLILRSNSGISCHRSESEGSFILFLLIAQDLLRSLTVVFTRLRSRGYGVKSHINRIRILFFPPHYVRRLTASSSTSLRLFQNLTSFASQPWLTNMDLTLCWAGQNWKLLTLSSRIRLLPPLRGMSPPSASVSSDPSSSGYFRLSESVYRVYPWILKQPIHY